MKLLKRITVLLDSTELRPYYIDLDQSVIYDVQNAGYAFFRFGIYWDNLSFVLEALQNRSVELFI